MKIKNIVASGIAAFMLLGSTAVLVQLVLQASVTTILGEMEQRSICLVQ